MKPLRQFEGSPLQKWTAVFFALVMVGFGFVLAVHVHDAVAGQASPASHCSLCVVAHNAAVITPLSAAPAPVVQATVLETSEPQLDSRQHAGLSCIRPPPQAL